MEHAGDPAQTAGDSIQARAGATPVEGLGFSRARLREVRSVLHVPHPDHLHGRPGFDESLANLLYPELRPFPPDGKPHRLKSASEKGFDVIGRRRDGGGGGLTMVLTRDTGGLPKAMTQSILKTDHDFRQAPVRVARYQADPC